MIFETLFTDPIAFVLWVMAIIFGLTIHEFSHGLSAKLQGDPTAEHEGRLTLNPLAHIDWLGFFLLIFAGFGWAKPTPFNPYNLKYRKYGSALVALAGPISNTLAVIIIGGVLFLVNTFTGLGPDNLMVLFFLYLIQINILLAVFNLIPIPPLDGSKILYSFIGERYPQVVVTLERYGMILLIALIFLGGDLISSVFYYFYALTLNIIFGVDI